MLKSTKQKIVGPLLVLAGVIALGAGIGEYFVRGRLKVEGLTASGQAVGHRLVTSRRGAKTYELTVQYQPQTGGPIQKEFDVSQSIYDSTGKGQQVEVHYLASDPEKADIPGAEIPGFEEMVVGTLMALGGGLLSYFGYRKPSVASYGQSSAI